MRELRRHRSIHCNAANASVRHAAQEILKSIEVHGFVQNILHHFIDKRMVRNLDVAGNIFLAGSDIGENGGQQVVAAHALNLRRNFLASLKTQQR